MNPFVNKKTFEEKDELTCEMGDVEVEHESLMPRLNVLKHKVIFTFVYEYYKQNGSSSLT